MNSLAKENPRNLRRFSRWIALAMCFSFASLATYQAYHVQIFPTALEITKTEDEVYEAIIRELLPKFEEAHAMRLVFEDKLVIDSFPPDDYKACRDASALPLQVADDPPLSDNATSKSDAVIARGLPVETPGEDVVDDYLRKRCIGGRLSHSLHTDVPHNFFEDYVRANDGIMPGPGDPEFARLFPGAPGVLAFSRIGLSKRLDEAIVSTSFYCGGLCGGGHRYFLKKVNGQWKVVSNRMTWVS